MMKTLPNNQNTVTPNKFVTIREQEILDLIAHEYSSKEIASELYVSYETVQSHRKSLLRKLAVKNTAGLVRVGFERGLIKKRSRMMMICFFFLAINISISSQTTLDFFWENSNMIPSIQVENPHTGIESIFLYDDGTIQHQTNSGDMYTDNSIIYTDHEGVIRHATFESGLWMIRQYDTTSKRPFGMYHDITSILRYNDGADHDYEATVQNCSFTTGPNFTFGLQTLDYKVSGLPLQYYKSREGWKSDSDGIRTGSMYSYHNTTPFPFFPIDNNYQLWGDAVTIYDEQEIDDVDWGSSQFPNHVLPFETKKFELQISSGDGAVNILNQYDVRLYVGESASYRPVNGDDYVQGVESNGYSQNVGNFKFDISSLNLEGGQKFFLLAIRTNSTIVEYLYVPVVLEKPIGNFIVEGETTGPPEVKMVIHDPPGSESFAVYEAGSTICRTEEITIGTSSSNGEEYSVQAGFGFELFGVEVDLSTQYTNGIVNTTTAISSSSLENCITFTTTINTSDQNGFYDNGDIYLGLANKFNVLRGDRYFWNEDNAELIIDEALYLHIGEPEKFELNGNQIEQRICDLQNELSQISQSAGETIDEFNLRKALINQAIDGWYDMLTDNKAILADPSIPKIDSDVTIPVEGGSSMVTEKIESTIGRTISYELSTTKNEAVAGSAVAGGFGADGTQKWSATKTFGTSDQINVGVSVENEYTLKDGSSQVLENTVATVHIDPRFGNKFFRVKSDSRTSCPYEGGNRIDQPSITSRIASAHPNESKQIYISGVPSGTSIPVPIDICNLFEFNSGSTVGEFRLIRELNSGNGANVEIVSNDPLQNSFELGDPFEVGWGSCFGDAANQTVQNIFISQNSAGDLNYDESTDEIRLRLFSDCDEDTYDVLSISVRFTDDPNATTESINMNAECEFLQDTDRAIHFDGIDDHVDIHVKEQPFIFSSFTYEFWVNPERKLIENQPISNIFGSQSAASTTGGFPFVIFPENGREIGSNQLAVGVAVGTDGVQVVEHYYGQYLGVDIAHAGVVLNHPAVIDDWTHIAVVYEGRIPTLYINGLEVDVGLQSQFLGVHPSFQLGGGEINGVSNYFGGSLDDLRIWSYARTANQINQDKTNKLSGNEAGLVRLYLFDSQSPGASNANQGLVDFSGKGSTSEAVLQNFNYGTISSNWVHGRVAQYCAGEECPQSLELSDTQLDDFDYRSASYIHSDQSVLASADVEYDAKTEIILSGGFEIEEGAVFNALIHGCDFTVPTKLEISSIFAVGDVVSPSGEGLENIIDGDIDTKFLNFAKRIEFIVDLNTPQEVTTIAVTTANDEPGRDPMWLVITGSHDGVNFNTVGGDFVDCISERHFTRYMDLPNSTFRYYKIRSTVTCESDANSMQLAEVEFWGM